jgi:hypothetical protein
VKSTTHNWFGRRALNCRSTKSSGRATAGSERVVRIVAPRTTPRNPAAFINRSTVQRATVKPSRCS